MSEQDEMTSEAYPNDPRLRIRKLNRVITGWQRHIDRMAKILRCFGTDKDVEEAALKLKAEVRRLTEQNRLLVEAIDEMPRQVPTNWLDSLLSGPEATVSKASDCREIEALLRGIQDRLRSKAQAALAAIEGGEK